MIDYLTFDDVQILPRYSEIESRSVCSTLTRFTRNHLIENPLVGAPMDTVCGPEMVVQLWQLGGVGILHRFMDIESQVECIKKIKFAISKWSVAESNFDAFDVNRKPQSLRFIKPVIACSVGATGDWYDRAMKSIDAGANVILIDVAHGHHEHVRKAILRLSDIRLAADFQFDIIAGNVATREGALDLVTWGADAVRVGIGPGSACETRIRTGIGVPQLTAILETAEAISETNIPIIADGGIRYIGDVAKAIAAGASTVMLGSLFAGTNEAPGEIHTDGVWPTPRRRKLYRGSASESQKMSGGNEIRHVEGTAKLIPLKGPVRPIVEDILDGLKSSMSYLGVQDIPGMQLRAQFIRITPAGMDEARPHILRE